MQIFFRPCLSAHEFFFDHSVRENQRQERKHKIDGERNPKRKNVHAETQGCKNQKRNSGANPHDSVCPVVFFYVAYLLWIDFLPCPEIHGFPGQKRIDSYFYECQRGYKACGRKNYFSSHRFILYQRNQFVNRQSGFVSFGTSHL